LKRHFKYNFTKTFNRQRLIRSDADLAKPLILQRLGGYRSKVFMNRRNFYLSLLLLVFFAFTVNIFGQRRDFSYLGTAEEQFNQLFDLNFKAFRKNSAEDANSVNAVSLKAFPNPILLNFGRACAAENLNFQRFNNDLSADQRMAFCEAIQKVSFNLNRQWSPALKSEIQQIWQVFIRENVKICPMKKGVSSKIVAMAGAFTEDQNDKQFNATFYLRPERTENKSFFLVFMHELRHVFDDYLLWKNKSNLTQAEMEKRAFRIMGKIYQETPDKIGFWNLPTLWKDDWKNLSQNEIERRREEKIENFMRRSSLYKKLLKNPNDYIAGYTTIKQAQMQDAAVASTVEIDREKLPARTNVRISEKEIPQNITEVSFAMEKTRSPKNPSELLQAALKNEKNLYYKMDNFVYDQNLQLQCWKKQKVEESYNLERSVARVQDGKTLFHNESSSSSNSSKTPKLPSCVLNFDSIKTDATETFWAAPYLDEMPVKFDHFTEIDGIPVARYTVYQPSAETFNKIAARYPNISPFRAFVGTLWISVEDSQIIRFAGTSFPESEVTGYQCANRCASYGATAVRQKLSSGIWVTTLLNTVAITDKNGKLKPFNYVVKYQNYRQGTSDVKILEEVETSALSSR
jgi:hypothetical protein